MPISVGLAADLGNSLPVVLFCDFRLKAFG
jgi:hypothetical protein